MLLWALTDDARLSQRARGAIIEGGSRVLVSAVSAWEITIKKRLGKLRAPDDLLEQLTERRFAPLYVTLAHALAVGELPDHHADPFDRLLISQARMEGLTLVTRDERIRRYDVATIPA